MFLIYFIFVYSLSENMLCLFFRGKYVSFVHRDVMGVDKVVNSTLFQVSFYLRISVHVLNSIGISFPYSIHYICSFLLFKRRKTLSRFQSWLGIIFLGGNFSFK
uniref:Uncharacterized protein n=1 Tax=Nelumbo nucifera TaxID=4432 RepID=A0A822ZMY0_NELNU|nr:TPA_asm: hypothetical protein HUJ06_003065 [Nelumbo nucifera]